jgi:penicillin-binding protein 2
MLKSSIIKNYKAEVRLFTKRGIVLLCGLLLLFLILICRLVYLQIIQHPLYTTLSAQNQLSLMPIVPKRGLIYDRKGILLAENIPVFSLDIIPDKIKNLQATLQDITKIIAIDSVDLQEFYKQLKIHRRFEHIPLKHKI